MDTESNAVRNLLIDFGSEGDMCKDRRGYFQNTWVSFEENESSHDLNFISHLHDNSMICSWERPEQFLFNFFYLDAILIKFGGFVPEFEFHDFLF